MELLQFYQQVCPQTAHNQCRLLGRPTVVNRLFVCVQKAVALANLWELEEYGFGEEEHTGKYCTVLPCSICVVAPLGCLHRPELAAHGLQSQHTQTSTHTSISCSSGNTRP